MSTRYVWEKYTYTEKDGAIDGSSQSTISVLPLGSLTLCSEKPVKNSNGTYSPSGNTHTISTYDTSDGYQRFYLRDYPYAVRSNENFYYITGYTSVLSTSAAYNDSYGWYSGGENANLLVGHTQRSSVEGSAYSFLIYSYQYAFTIVQGSLIETLSSNSKNKYSEGVSGEYYYVYKGSDSIDPKSIKYATSAQVEEDVKYTITPSSSNLYGGTITYVKELSNKGGPFEHWGTDRTSTTGYITPHTVGDRQIRVYAKDSWGFTSSTYATGPILSVYKTVSLTTSVSPSGGGTVTGAGSYDAGTSVTVKATASSGYSFSHWLNNGNQVSTNSSYTFTINDNTTLTAVFTSIQYTITASVSPSGSGTVSGAGVYGEGANVTLQATVKTGYSFSGWQEGSATVSTSASYTFTANSNRSLTAVFIKVQHTISTLISPSGAGTVTGAGTYDYGSSVSVNAIANSGYIFSGWYENSSLVSNYSQYNFAVTSNRSLEARFSQEVAPPTPTPTTDKKEIYVGIGNIARKVPNIYVGVNNVARKVVKGYVGVNNTARLFFDGYSQPSDLSVWETVTLPSSVKKWSDITYGNGKFVAVENGSYIAAYSTDGINWSSTTMPTVVGWPSVAFGEGKFVSKASGSDAAYSTDGINWTGSTIPSGIASRWESIAYGNGMFMAVASGSTNAVYTYDGISWYRDKMSYTFTRPWYDIVYGKDKFVAISPGTYGNYKADNQSWAEMSMPNFQWRSVTYGNNLFVATPYESDQVAFSTDGIKWSTATMPFSANWDYVAFGGDKFLAVATGTNKAVYSTNGFVWNTTTLPFSGSWSGIAYGNGKFVIIEYGTDKAAVIQFK